MVYTIGYAPKGEGGGGGKGIFSWEGGGTLPKIVINLFMAHKKLYKKNYIGLAVTEILRYKQTNTQNHWHPFNLYLTMIWVEINEIGKFTRSQQILPFQRSLPANTQVYDLQTMPKRNFCKNQSVFSLEIHLI